MCTLYTFNPNLRLIRLSIAKQIKKPDNKEFNASTCILYSLIYFQRKQPDQKPNTTKSSIVHVIRSRFFRRKPDNPDWVSKSSATH